MAKVEFQTLLSAIREQLDRNGLRENFRPDQLSVPAPDITAIRLTIEREEKQYLSAINE